MTAEDHRTWPLPKRKWFMRMNWHELLFMHWPVSADSLKKHLPDQLSVDTYQGQAWIGVVPFRMTGVAPRLLPDVPGLSAFPELNVRTYVTHRGEKPGVWFFSLDAPQWLAVRAARSLFHLPYMDAVITMEREQQGWKYGSRRTHRGEASAEFDVTYQPSGGQSTTSPGTLEHWLTARYCLYCAHRDRVYRGEISHPPWQLQNATCEIRKNTMTDWLDLEMEDQPPLLHYAERTDVVAWTNDRVDS